jgi:rRNA-processing protein FCF1
MKGRIIIDTNFLFVPFYYKIDIFQELAFDFKDFSIEIPNVAFLELKKIKKRKSKDKLYVDAINNMLKELIKNKRITIVNTTEKSVDDYIITEVKKMKEKREKLGICTNDKNLKRKVREIAKKESLKNVFMISTAGKKLIF